MHICPICCAVVGGSLISLYRLRHWLRHLLSELKLWYDNLFWPN